MSYQRQAQALDAEILRVIGRWHMAGTALTDAEFDELALAIFAHQLRYNAPYARYCASLGVTLEAMPPSWDRIPPVPTSAYRETTLATFDPTLAALAFVTSGTTSGIGGRHYMETRTLYDAALLAGFDRFVLSDGARLRYLNLVPNPSDRPDSSLGYMLGRICAERGDAATGWYLRGDDFFIEAFLADAQEAIRDRQPVCIPGTAFAFVALLDLVAERGVHLELPAGSRVMETGGFKGRSRVIDREQLYAGLTQRLGIPPNRIIAEYGMTELTSQWYDDVATRVKRAPPWLRAYAIGENDRRLAPGTLGTLVHVDLANRSSCVAIASDDLGVETQDGILLHGRQEGSEPRGCSLDAQTLRARHGV